MKVDDLGNMMPNVVRDNNDPFAVFCQTNFQIYAVFTRHYHEFKYIALSVDSFDSQST